MPDNHSQFTVNKFTDEGSGQPGTLSWAIKQANDDEGAKTITFKTDVRLALPST